MKTFPLLCAACLTLACADPEPAATPSAALRDESPVATSATEGVIENGAFWRDTRGQRIEAHGGGFLQVGDVWYWFGEDKAHSGAGFRGVNCYASRDLVNWALRRAVVTPRSAPELSAPDRIIERPKVIYNARTRKYVMWLHWEGKDYAEAKAGVFSSDTVDGPYRFHSAFRPLDHMSRDDTLFQDDDGKAYFISAANHNADLMVYALTDDYLRVARLVAKLWPGAYREAPAMFKQAGTYYLITSGATGWDPNQAKYATAKNLAGPWSALTNLGNANTFDTQPTYVLPIHGRDTTTFLLAGDRWKDPDLASSKYVWLPLTVRGTSLSLAFHERLRVDLATGSWSAVTDPLVPQRGWKVVRASSEETSKEDGRAARAFDGDPRTFWHTRYTGGELPYPHELVIDLGATYELAGLRYLPRQDNNDNGTIGSFALYASDDPGRWGVPVTRGAFDAGTGRKRVTFAKVNARYVRFVGEREQLGRVWASVSELELIGRAAP